MLTILIVNQSQRDYTFQRFFWWTRLRMFWWGCFFEGLIFCEFLSLHQYLTVLSLFISLKAPHSFNEIAQSFKTSCDLNIRLTNVFSYIYIYISSISWLAPGWKIWILLIHLNQYLSRWSVIINIISRAGLLYNMLSCIWRVAVCFCQ